jgi:hypothetical protein
LDYNSKSPFCSSFIGATVNNIFFHFGVTNSNWASLQSAQKRTRCLFNQPNFLSSCVGAAKLAADNEITHLPAKEEIFRE